MGIERAHWFDVLSSSLVRDSHRRGLLRAAGILGAGFVFGDTASARANGKKKRKPKKGRPKPPPAPPPLCSGGACAAEPEWAGQPGQIDHCEFICRQCDGDDAREFCIRDGTKPDGTPTKVAVCCDEGESCCDGTCIPTRSDEQNCGGCGVTCEGFSVCISSRCVCGSNSRFVDCPNFGCVDTHIDTLNCGGCANVCGVGQTCRNGQCACPATCPQGQPCIHNDGSFCVEIPNRTDCHCGCPPGFKYCPNHFGGACVSQHSPVC